MLVTSSAGVAAAAREAAAEAKAKAGTQSGTALVVCSVEHVLRCAGLRECNRTQKQG